MRLIKFVAVPVSWVLLTLQCNGQGDTVTVRTNDALEAAKILAQLDFLEKDCNLKVTVNNRDALIGAVIRGSSPSMVEHYRKDAQKMASTYGQKAACEGLAKTYGWKRE